MSYKTIIEIEGIEREILNFSIDYFIPNLWLTIDKDTIHWTMEDYRKIPLANKLSAKGKEPFGGLLNIVMESTSNDDLFWQWFNDDKVNKGIRTTQGEIRIYSAKDEDIPIKRIEFWDCFVSSISENFSSIGNSPMTLDIQLSPAILRFNKEVVFKKSWWWTDIDRKESIAENNEKGNIILKRAYWIDEDGKEIECFPINESVSLYVELEGDYNTGDSINIELLDEDEAGVKKIKATGTINSDELLVINDFQIEYVSEQE